MDKSIYKQSKYNIILTPISNAAYTYIYNTKSGAIIKLEKILYELIEKSAFETSALQPLLSDLLKQGIVVPRNKNELNEIIFFEKASQFNLNFQTLTLIIAPTLQCNYKCIYCFEDRQNTSTTMMSEITITNIVSFVNTFIKENQQLKRLKIHWFGGEPLLGYQDVIVPLSEKLIELTRAHNIDYEAGIVTNGYLLSPEIQDKLIRLLKVYSLQITFDGQKHNYEKLKRPPKQAYEKAKDNILYLSEYIYDTKQKVQVNIRINVEKNNANDSELFYSEIKSNSRYKNNFNFYLGRLRSIVPCDDYLTLSEFEDLERRFNDVIKKQARLIIPKKIWCSQYSMSCLCIGPEGELYKCEHDFGVDERIIGNVLDGIEYPQFLLDYFNMPVDQACKECNIYPICLGGCPNARFINKHHCEYTIKKIINNACNYINSQKH